MHPTDTFSLESLCARAWARRRNRNGFILAGMASLGLLLGACSSIERTDTAAIDTLGATPAWTAAAASSDVFSARDWTADFQDPELQGLIDEALAGNFSLQAAYARLDAARELARMSGAQVWPSATLNSTGSRYYSEASNMRSDTFTANARVSWELDLWGRVRASAKSAQAGYEATEADMRAARFSLAANTAAAWYAAVEAKAQLELSQMTLDAFRDNLQVINERFGRGLSSALEVRLMRANVASAEASYEQRLRMLDSSVRSLEVLLGRYPANALEVSDALPELDGRIPAGLPSELLQRRPDLQAAELRLRAAELDADVAHKNRYPSISLTATGGTSSDELDELIDSDFHIWNLAYNLSQPLFDSGRLAAAADRADAQYNVSLASYGQTLLNAFREVETVLVAQESLAREERVSRVQMEESIAAETLAWEQYNRGLVDIITVLESQRRAFSARRTFLDVQQARVQNRIDLYLALGGGFDVAAPAEASE